MKIKIKKNNGIKNICFMMAFIFMLGTFPNMVAAESLAIKNEASDQVAFFEPRLTEPARENAYFYDDNLYFKGGYGLPNCTAYAWGRAYEILGSQPNLPMGNANDWWGRNLETQNYSYGSTPQLGAVICWGSGSSGHVAVVEAIEGDSVTYSESAFSGPIFTADTYTIGTEDTVSVGGFQGYIYIGDFIDMASDKVAPIISNLEISQMDETGFSLKATVSDQGTGIDKVLFPVWTDKNGQDDLIWYQATIDQNTTSCRILYQDHNNEKGDYLVHGRAYDKAGLESEETIKKTILIDYRSSKVAMRMMNLNF